MLRLSNNPGDTVPLSSPPSAGTEPAFGIQFHSCDITCLPCWWLNRRVWIRQFVHLQFPPTFSERKQRLKGFVFWQVQSFSSHQPAIHSISADSLNRRQIVPILPDGHFRRVYFPVTFLSHRSTFVPSEESVSPHKKLGLLNQHYGQNVYVYLPCLQINCQSFSTFRYHKGLRSRIGFFRVVCFVNYSHARKKNMFATENEELLQLLCNFYVTFLACFHSKSALFCRLV